MADRHEQLHTPEHIDSKAEIRPEDLEAFVEQLLQASEALIQEGIQSPAAARLGAMERLGETPAEAQALTARTLEAAHTLQAELREQLQPTATKNPLFSEDTATALTAAAAASVVDKGTDKTLPTIDGVKAPIKPLEEAEGAGDNDEELEVATTVAATQIAAVEASDTDPYADRNKASAKFLEKLADPDFSFPGQSDPQLLKTIRELLLLHQHDALAVRTDDLGNLVIGVAETGGNGLRTRLLTVHHERNQGTLAWLQRSMAEEFNTLKRYPVVVMEDPNLDHTPQAEAMAA